MPKKTNIPVKQTKSTNGVDKGVDKKSKTQTKEKSFKLRIKLNEIDKSQDLLEVSNPSKKRICVSCGSVATRISRAHFGPVCGFCA